MTIQLKKCWPLLMLLAVYLGTIGFRPLFIPDEPRYAQIAREMRQTGEYSAPRLLGLRYYEKPVLGHWLNAGSQALFGENFFSARFSSALSTLLTGALVWLLALRLGPNREENRELGITAVTLFFSFPLVFAVGTYAVLDAPFTLFVTATMVAFFYGATEPRPGRRALYLLLAGIACGLAFLTKGFIALALPTLTALGYLIWQKEYRRLLTLPWLPLAGCVLTALPWALRVHQLDPDFWHYFFWIEHIQRAIGDEHGQHPEPFWFFVPIAIVGVLPWLLFSGALVRGWRRDDLRRPLLRFAVVLAAAVLVFFSIPNGKLGTYILPAFPALAVLGGWGLNSYFRRVARPWSAFDRPLRIAVPVLAVLAALFFLYQVLGRFRVIPSRMLLYFPSENWMLAVVALMLMLVLWKLAREEAEPAAKVLNFALGLGVVMLVVHFVMPVRFTADLAPERFIRQVAGPRLQPGVELLADKDLAVVTGWALDTTRIRIYDRPGELAYGLEKPEAAGRQVTPEQLRELVASKTPIVLITDSERRVRAMPDPKRYTRRGKNFIVEFNL